MNDRLERSLLGTAVVIFALVVIAAVLPMPQGFNLEQDTLERAQLASIAREAATTQCEDRMIQDMAVQCGKRSGRPIVMIVRDF